MFFDTTKAADDALQHRDLGLDHTRHDDVGVEPGEARERRRPIASLRRGAREAADQLAREVLQPALFAAAPVNESIHSVERVESIERVDELVVRDRPADPLVHRGDERVVLDPCAERGEIEVAVDDRVLEVVHRVRDVVGEVHDLGLDAESTLGCAPRASSRKTVTSSG